ncbi:MAG: hypothetical protein IIB94_09785 [Candidatus Marinimicrobia bacterium]|nr:hypothetical protein [Candidatus Neomarinimicrobiota bacterium]
MDYLMSLINKLISLQIVIIFAISHLFAQPFEHTTLFLLSGEICVGKIALQEDDYMKFDKILIDGTVSQQKIFMSYIFKIISPNGEQTIVNSDLEETFLNAYYERIGKERRAIIDKWHLEKEKGNWRDIDWEVSLSNGDVITKSSAIDLWKGSLVVLSKKDSLFLPIWQITKIRIGDSRKKSVGKGMKRGFEMPYKFLVKIFESSQEDMNLKEVIALSFVFGVLAIVTIPFAAMGTVIGGTAGAINISEDTLDLMDVPTREKEAIIRVLLEVNIDAIPL